MAKKTETPFHKIMLVRQNLRLFVEYGDHALDGRTPQELAADAVQCLEWLMEFRNIINGMVSLDEPPSRAVVPYLSEDVIADLVAR